MSHALWVTVVGFNILAASLPLTVLVAYLRPSLFPWSMAVFLGLVAGFVNLQTDDVQFPALLLLAFGFFAGHQVRSRVWLTPVVLAFWIPAGEGIRFALGWAPGPGTYPLGPFLAFIPAILGTALGRGVIRFARREGGSAVAPESPSRRPS